MCVCRRVLGKWGKSYYFRSYSFDISHRVEIKYLSALFNLCIYNNTLLDIATAYNLIY